MQWIGSLARCKPGQAASKQIPGRSDQIHLQPPESCECCHSPPVHDEHPIVTDDSNFASHLQSAVPVIILIRWLVLALLWSGMELNRLELHSTLMQEHRYAQ